VHRKLKDKITMRSFIIYLNFVSLLAVCLFACNHHSSNPMLQHLSYGNGKADAYYNMGDLYVDLEQYDSARHYLEKSLFLSPSRSIPYWSLAVMEAELGNFKSAYHYLDTFVMVQDSLDNSELLTEEWWLQANKQTASKLTKFKYIINERIVILSFSFLCTKIAKCLYNLIYKHLSLERMAYFTALR
jgi:tetratricopeptide (TPR) repeat protein